MREDYSADGNAWDYLPHDHARSRAYRWGEDGIAGICDRPAASLLCARAVERRRSDPQGAALRPDQHEGNHGEDVKEYYFYLDNVPSHAYMRVLYKYPQAAFPYAELVAENARRGAAEPEYELIDTGVFDGDRYFDVFVEYAKAAPDDILMRITRLNRGPEPARAARAADALVSQHVVVEGGRRSAPRCSERRRTAFASRRASDARHAMLYAEERRRAAVHRERDERRRLFGIAEPAPYVKDGIHDRIVDGARKR